MKNGKPLGIKDVAKKANVAVATVDRVIHGRTGVSAKTREKVLKVIKELNFQPNVLASNLSRKKNVIIGVLLPKPSPESSYWDLPIDGVKRAQDELEQYGARVELYLFDRNDRSDMRRQILNIINSEISGLVLTPKFADEVEFLLQDCQQKNIPYVFIDSNLTRNDCLCSIQQPLYESGQLAAQLFSYCFSEGRILIMHFRNEMDTTEIITKKESGMSDYFSEIGSEIKVEKLVMQEYDDEQVETAMKEALEKYPDLKGVFIPNSKIAPIGKYLVDNPDAQLKLIGYDLLKENYHLLEEGVINFLICQKPEEQGYLAVNKLFEHVVLKKEVEKEVLMPLDIITRKNYKYY